MLGLYSAALKKGLPAVPLKTDLKHLTRFMSPSIAFVDSNHFFVVHKVSWWEVTIQDPPDKPRKISKKEFLKQWNGEALVFSKELRKSRMHEIVEMTAPPSGSRMIFSETSFDAGLVDEGVTVQHTFSFANIGSDTLTISTRKSCGCTILKVSGDKTPPDGSGEITVEFNTSSRHGPSRQTVDVRTNDTANKLITLTLSATVKSSVITVPDRLYIGEISAGKTVARDITVIDSGEGKLTIEKIETPDGITAHILPARQDSTLGLVVPVKLTVAGSAAPGDFEKQVIIHTITDRPRTITIPVSGEVIGLYKAMPPVLFFGAVNPGETATRELILTPSDGKKQPLPTVKSPSPNLTIAITPLDSGAKYTLSASFKAPRNAVTLNDTLAVSVQGKKAPALLVPVYARVAE